MKTMKLFLAVAVWVGFFAGCTKESDTADPAQLLPVAYEELPSGPGDKPSPEYNFSVYPATLKVPAEGGTFQVLLSSYVGVHKEKWDVVPYGIQQSFGSFNSTSGNGGNQLRWFTVEPCGVYRECTYRFETTGWLHAGDEYISAYFDLKIIQSSAFSGDENIYPTDWELDTDEEEEEDWG